MKTVYLCKQLKIPHHHNFLKMTEKYFTNPFDDFSEGIPALTEYNSLRKDCKLCCGLNSKWQDGLKKLQSLRETHDMSVYTGSSGVAMLHLKKNSENLQCAKQLLGLDKLKRRRQTFLCGDGGPLALGIIINHKLGLQNEMNALAKRLQDLSRDVLDLNSDLPNEYMYGRAGYLYAILYVNNNVQPHPFDDSFIREIIEAILISGKNMAKAGKFKCPLMYQWHDSYYLGAAHGLSGILYLLLQIKEYLTEEDLNLLIKPTIEYLKTHRFPSGNFPSSLGRDSDKYVQWCHGSPGFLYLFSEAYKVFQKPEYLQIALECADVIWKRGLLKKGYSLCHGVSGNAYCFLQLYQITNEDKHLYRALKFAEWCYDYTRDHEQSPPDRPLSLYEGIAGPLYLLIDIQKPLEAKFPGFTL